MAELNNHSYAPFRKEVTTTNTEVLTEDGLEHKTRGVLVISGLTGETIKVTGRVGGADWGDLLSKDNAGTEAAAATLGDGVYYLDFHGFGGIHIVKSAGVENVTCKLQVL